MSATSAICDMEMERLDQEIEKARKQFYTALLGKKRRVKRKWLEISAMTNTHLLQTLPYRAMLGHVAQLVEERDKVISDTLNDKDVTRNVESDETLGNCDDSETDKVDVNKTLEGIQNIPIVESTFTEDDKDTWSSQSSPLARDEAIQTEESSFPHLDLS